MTVHSLPNRFRINSPRMLVRLGYLFLTLIATFPRIFTLLDYPSPGLPEYDTGQWFWNFWYVLEQLKSGGSLYHTDLIFHPEGANLVFYTLDLANTLPILPFQALGVPQLGYNLLFLVVTFLSGYGVYLLCRDLKLDERASWIAGALFLLCPYRFGQIEHLNLINTFPLPFYLLWMRRALLGTGWKAPVLWGLWLFIAANTSSYYLQFLLIISPFWWVAVVGIHNLRTGWRKPVSQSLRAVLVFLVLFTPQLNAILRYYDPVAAQRPLPVAMYWSADLLNLFLPPLWGERLLLQNPSLPHTLSGRGEFAVFPGMIVWFLTVVSCLAGFRRIQGKFWLFLAFLGALLSLGPLLKILHPVQLPEWVGGFPFLLPGYLLMQLPLLGAARTFARWSLIFQMGLILFLASNYSRIERWMNNRLKIHPGLFAFSIILLTFVENWQGSLPHSGEQPPVQMLHRMAQTDDTGAVLHLPSGNPRHEGHYMYLQTFHGLPILNGYTPFRTGCGDLLNQPFLALLEKQEILFSDWEEFEEDLLSLNINWIVLHSRYYQDVTQYEWIISLLENHLGAIRFDENESVRIYRLRPRT